MYRYLFGPVPSRRLGISLGVDLVPHKVCSLDCVYCECGATTKRTLDRKEYVPYHAVVNELDHYFENNPDPEYITFSGAGEPTLNSRMGDILEHIKRCKPFIPVAVLTNGTLLFQREVRKDLQKADVVLPSLDAATETAFQKINRPVSNYKLTQYIDGLIRFRNEFKGEIWLEVLFIPNYNDDEKNLIALKKAILKMKPDKIQLNSLDRPGTVSSIHTADYNYLKRIVEFWNLKNVEIIADPPKRKDVKSYREDIENTILETISRRPCTLEDMAEILGLHVNEVNKYLGVLERDGRIKTEVQKRGVFYRTK